MNLMSLYQSISGKSPNDMLISKTEAKKLLKENPKELEKIKEYLETQPHNQAIIGALFNISYVKFNQ